MVTSLSDQQQFYPDLWASGFIPEQEKYGRAYALAVNAPSVPLLGLVVGIRIR